MGNKTQNILSEDLVCYPGRSVFAKLISFGPVSPPEPAGISELCGSQHAQGKSFLLPVLVCNALLQPADVPGPGAGCKMQRCNSCLEGGPKKNEIKIANIYLQYEGVEILQSPLRVSREYHQPRGNWMKINCNSFSRHKLLPKK